MKDRSTSQKNWYELGKIARTQEGTYEIRDILIRWNEAQEEDEHVYDAHRFTIQLDEDIRPGREAVEYYLEQAKDAIIAKAQALAAQEEGLDADDE